MHREDDYIPQAKTVSKPLRFQFPVCQEICAQLSYFRRTWAIERLRLPIECGGNLKPELLLPNGIPRDQFLYTENVFFVSDLNHIPVFLENNAHSV